MITKDMIIGDVLKKHPDVAGIMLEHGLHCVGCHANVFDTIEAGCKIHGIDDATIEGLVKQINEFVKEQPEKKDVPKEVSITDAASKKIGALLKEGKQEGYGLRVMVMPGGCSGYMYQMSFEKSSEDGDVVLESNGVKVFIDKESLDMLGGAEIDYIDTLNESGFKINNPNAKDGCGCGKSFS